MTDRDNKGHFITGNTCGGRKKIPKEFIEAVLSYTSEALQTIVDVMNDKEAPVAIRLKAATYLLDRAFGKPVDTLIADELNPHFQLQF